MPAPLPASQPTTFADRDLTMRKAGVPMPLRMPVHAVLSGRELLRRAIFGKPQQPPSGKP